MGDGSSSKEFVDFYIWPIRRSPPSLLGQSLRRRHVIIATNCSEAVFCKRFVVEDASEAPA